MTGVVKVGTATGQMVLPLLAALLMGIVGWRYAALALGYGGAALLLIAAFSMSAPPKSRAPAGSAERRGPPFAVVRRGRAFWTLCLMQFLFFPSLVTVPLHIAVHGIDLGMTRTAAATLLTVIGAASIVGRMSVGTFADRIGGRNSYILSLMLLVAALLLLLAVEAHGPLFAAVAVYGFAHGGLFTVSPHRGRVLRHPRPWRDLRRHRVLRHHRRRGRSGRCGQDLRRDRQLRLRVHRACRDGRRRTGARAHVAEARAEVARSVLSRYTVPESLVERCCECALYTNAAFVDDVS